MEPYPSPLNLPQSLCSSQNRQSEGKIPLGTGNRGRHA